MHGLSNDTVVLGEYFTTRMIPKDTLILDAGGYGVFEGKTEFPGGLYLIYYSPTHYFDLLLGDDQQFAVIADTSDLAGSMEFKGSEDNLIFLDYKNNLQQKRAELEQQKSLLSNTTSEADSTGILGKINLINQEMEDYMQRIVSEHPSLFVSVFILATQEPVPPDELLTGERRHDDSVRYFYYKEHYFDHFDPFNVRLLHTPLYEGKIKNYIYPCCSSTPRFPDCSC